MPIAIEHERKFLPPAPEAERLCEGEPYVDIRQGYISTPGELPELRVRKETSPSGETRYTTTLKQGELPDRMELEVEITEEAYEHWNPQTIGIVEKRRYLLPHAAGKLVIDQFNNGLWLAELEAGTAEDEEELRQRWQDVTDKPDYRNRNLAVAEASMPIETLPTNQEEVIASLIERQKASSRPLVIGIAGGTASGKTTFAKQLQEATGGILVSIDDYYHGQTFMKEVHGYDFTEVNWDHPEAFNLRLVARHLGQLASGETVEKPIYSWIEFDPLPEAELITAEPGKPIIVEGLYTLHADLVGALNARLYFDAPRATRIARRINRDSSTRETSWPIESNFRFCMEVAEPTFDIYGTPQKSAADLVINT